MSASESPSDPKARLGEHLRALETACHDADAGDPSGTAAQRIATSLHAIFQSEEAGAPSLLSRLGGSYTRVASCVPKTAHSQAFHLPLASITLDMSPGAAGYVLQASTGPHGIARPPRCHPTLGKVAAFRQIQAPDWWKSESVLVVDHSRATRRDLVAWAGGGPARDSAMPVIRIPLNYGVQLEVPAAEVLRAALRQMGHEVLGSPEVRKLAGR